MGMVAGVGGNAQGEKNKGEKILRAAREASAALYYFSLSTREKAIFLSYDVIS